MAQFLPKFARDNVVSNTDMNMSSLETEGPYALEEFQKVQIISHFTESRPKGEGLQKMVEKT